MQTLYPIQIKNFKFLFKNNKGKLNSSGILIKRKNNIINNSKNNNKTFINQMTQTTRNDILTSEGNNFSFLTILKENFRENNLSSIKEKSLYLPKIRLNEENMKVKISKINLKLPFNYKTLRENNIRNKFLSIMKDISFQNNQIGNLIYNELYDHKSKSIKKKKNNNNISFKNSLIQNSVQKSNSCRLILIKKIKKNKY